MHITYIAAFGYVAKTLLALSTTSGGAFIALFDTVVGAPFGLTNKSCFIKTMRKNKQKHIEIALLAIRKLRSIENITSKALTDVEIGNEEFTLVSNETEKYR